MDELAAYLQEAFERAAALRAGVPNTIHAAAREQLSTYTALLVLFTAMCAFVYVEPLADSASLLRNRPQKCEHYVWMTV